MSDLPPAAAKKPRRPQSKPNAQRRRELHPLLPELARRHPAVFGARPLPFKLGIFEDLLARHPDLDRLQLKAALSQHARSTPYLESVAAGERRHDLDGQAVEDVAPEHRHHAVMEVFRRRQQRMAGKDLRPWLIERLVQAIDASGLERDAYLERVRTGDPVAQQALDDAFSSRGERAARREAVRRAFEASGRSVTEFAQMYGLDVAVVEEAVAPAK
jgi:sRNA-binding protein